MKLLLVDVLEGKLLWSLADMPFVPENMQFSTDGRSMMAARGRTYCLWDLTTGSRTPVIYLTQRQKPAEPTKWKVDIYSASNYSSIPNKDTPQAIDSCVLLNQGYVFIDQGLYDGPTGSYVWEYDALPSTARYGDMLAAIDLMDKPRMLFCWPLITDTLITSLGRFHIRDARPQPQQGISTDLSQLQADDAQKIELRNHLIKVIEAAGLSYNPAVTGMQLVCKTIDGEKKKNDIFTSFGVRHQLDYTVKITMAYIRKGRQVIELERYANNRKYINILGDQSMNDLARTLHDVDLTPLYRFAIPNVITDPRVRPFGTSKMMHRD